MTGDELRASQAPLKAKYKDDPTAAQLILRRARAGHRFGDGHRRDQPSPPSRACTRDGRLGPGGVLRRHAAPGARGLRRSDARAVAKAMALNVRAGDVLAEGDIDFRGTLAVSKEAPVGFTAVRLRFELDTDATDEQVAKLIQLTERYCVVAQTIRAAVPVTSTAARR